MRASASPIPEEPPVTSADFTPASISGTPWRELFNTAAAQGAAAACGQGGGGGGGSVRGAVVHNALLPAALRRPPLVRGARGDERAERRVRHGRRAAPCALHRRL